MGTDLLELYTLARYASIEHYNMVWGDPGSLGGDGPDFQTMLSAFGELNALSLDATTEFLSGPLYGSPPVHAPSYPESYQLAQ